MNAVSKARLDTVHPELRSRVLKGAEMLEGEGIVIEVIQADRTWPQQDALFAKGRSLPSDVPCHHKGEAAARPVGSCHAHPLGATVTNAIAGESSHNFGLGVDLCPDLDTLKPGLQPDWNTSHPAWQRLVAVMESLGLKSGSHWKCLKDWPHFDYTGKYAAVPTPAMKSWYLEGGIDRVWQNIA